MGEVLLWIVLAFVGAYVLGALVMAGDKLIDWLADQLPPR